MKKYILILVLLAGAVILAACSASYTGIRNDSPAPDFQLKDLRGQLYSLEGLRGKIVLLNFWYTTCPQCVTEMPVFQSFHQAWTNRDEAVLLAVNVGENADTVNKFTQSRNYTFPVLLDSSTQVAGKYGVRYFPTSLIIDRDGLLKFSIIGPFKDAAAIEKHINSLLPS